MGEEKSFADLKLLKIAGPGEVNEWVGVGDKRGRPQNGGVKQQVRSQFIFFMVNPKRTKGTPQL